MKCLDLILCLLKQAEPIVLKVFVDERNDPCVCRAVTKCYVYIAAVVVQC